MLLDRSAQGVLPDDHDEKGGAVKVKIAWKFSTTCRTFFSPTSPNSLMKKFLPPLLILMALVSCQAPKNEPPQETHLGVLKHPFNVSDAANQSFTKGLLLLHSFEYSDALKAFQEASRADSTELMAYWGEAMSHYKALWGLQDVDAGRAVLAKVGKTMEERLSIASDELEADFWTGVEILYGEGEFYERNKAYADHMSKLYEKYPGNHEVAAFYALGLMWSVPGARDPKVFDLSAHVASGILEENPNHPGALHYLIHANDDPGYAQLAKLAADKYSKVAPDAAHALHMPSHIYLALGMWNDVVASNEASYGASVDRMTREGLDDKARGYHSYAWLHYVYLQQGRFEKAEQLLKDMQVYTRNVQNQMAKTYLIKIQNAQWVESGQWPEGVEPMYVDYSDLGLTSKAEQHFLKAMVAYENNDAQGINVEIDSVKNLVIAAELLITDEGIALCSAGTTRFAPSKADIVNANVMISQMKAMVAMLNNDDQLIETNLKEAVALEGKAQYSYGPPDIPYPSFEQYGDWLLTKKRYEEALVQFNRSLVTAKNRAKALHGKINALTMLGRETEASKEKEILSEFWQQNKVAMN